MNIVLAEPKIKIRARQFPCLMKHHGNINGTGNSSWKDIVCIVWNDNEGHVLHIPEGANTSTKVGAKIYADKEFGNICWQEYFGAVTFDNSLELPELQATDRRLEPGL